MLVVAEVHSVCSFHLVAFSFLFISSSVFIHILFFLCYSLTSFRGGGGSMFMVARG